MTIPFERRIDDRFLEFVNGSIEIMSPEIPEGVEEVYVLKDLFTTKDGKWEDGWAKDTYILPWQFEHTITNSCGHEVKETTFYDGGGDHNIFARVIKWCGDNTFVPERGIGMVDKTVVIENPALPGGAITTKTKDKQLWANEPMWGGNFYTYYPFGHSDKIVGAQMPANHHISVFGVWVEVPIDVYTSWFGPVEPEFTTLEEQLFELGQQNQVIQFNPNAAIQKVIFGDGFVPNSSEFTTTFDDTEYVAQRAEELSTGEVRVYFVEVGDWDNVNYV